MIKLALSLEVREGDDGKDSSRGSGDGGDRGGARRRACVECLAHRLPACSVEYLSVVAVQLFLRLVGFERTRKGADEHLENVESARALLWMHTCSVG